MPQAIFVERHGGPEVMSLRDHDPGAPGPGQVRIAVHAAGVNFIDTYQRSGLYPRTPPFVLGMEGAGSIEAVADDVSDLRVGQRVAWAQIPGSYASHILAKPASLVPVPDGVSSELAAAALLQGMTAHCLSHSVHAARPGETALVHAAAGGTGQLLTQFLKRAGVRVLGTCSTEGKASLCREAGADEVIRYDQVDFASEARRLTGGRGVDVVYDSVGQSTFDGSLKALRQRGLLVLFGQSSGPVPPFDIQRLNQHGSLYLTRPSLFHYVAERADLEVHASAVFEAIAAGELRVRVDKTYSFAQVAQAHRDLEARKSTGKLLLLAAARS